MLFVDKLHHQWNDIEQLYNRKFKAFFSPAHLNENIADLINGRARRRYFKFKEISPLYQTCLRIIADNIDTMWWCVPKIDEYEMELFCNLLSTDIDMGYAADYIEHPSFWRRCAEEWYEGYHNPYHRFNSWKVYFIEKYFGEYIEKLDPESIDYETVLRLSHSFAPYIYELTIRNLNPPEWPEQMKVDASTDTEIETEDDIGSLSNVSIGTHRNRHVKYFLEPQTLNRTPLQLPFYNLVNLTRLTICFGYKNYSRYDDVSFAQMTPGDGEMIAEALIYLDSLVFLKITRTIIPKRAFEFICKSLYRMHSLEELEFSHAMLQDDHVKDIVPMLIYRRNLTSLSLKGNRIQTSGIVNLAHALLLRDSRVRNFDISLNDLGDEGGKVVASILTRTTSLRRINLSGTRLKTLSGLNLAIALHSNTYLDEIDLSANEFDHSNAEGFLRAVENNENLKRLDLRMSGIPDETMADINKICFDNAERRRKLIPDYPIYDPIEIELGVIEQGESDSEPSEIPVEKKDDVDDQGQELINEAAEILTWAAAKVEYRGNDEDYFSSGLGPIIDKLINEKEQEIIEKARAVALMRQESIDKAIFEKEQRLEMEEDLEEQRENQLRLLALNGLRIMGRAGLLTRLLSTMKHDEIRGYLENIIKTYGGDFVPPPHAKPTDEEKKCISLFLPYRKKERKEYRQAQEVEVELPNQPTGYPRREHTVRLARIDIGCQAKLIKGKWIEDEAELLKVIQREMERDVEQDLDDSPPSMDFLEKCKLQLGLDFADHSLQNPLLADPQFKQKRRWERPVEREKMREDEALVERRAALRRYWLHAQHPLRQSPSDVHDETFSDTLSGSCDGNVSPAEVLPSYWCSSHA